MAFSSRIRNHVRGFAEWYVKPNRGFKVLKRPRIRRASHSFGVCLTSADAPLRMLAVVPLDRPMFRTKIDGGRSVQQVHRIPDKIFKNNGHVRPYYTILRHWALYILLFHRSIMTALWVEKTWGIVVGSPWLRVRMAWEIKSPKPSTGF